MPGCRHGEAAKAGSRTGGICLKAVRSRSESCIPFRCSSVLAGCPRCDRQGWIATGIERSPGASQIGIPRLGSSICRVTYSSGRVCRLRAVPSGRSGSGRPPYSDRPCGLQARVGSVPEWVRNTDAVALRRRSRDKHVSGLRKRARAVNVVSNFSCEIRKCVDRARPRVALGLRTDEAYVRCRQGIRSARPAIRWVCRAYDGCGRCHSCAGADGSPSTRIG